MVRHKYLIKQVWRMVTVDDRSIVSVRFETSEGEYIIKANFKGSISEFDCEIPCSEFVDATSNADAKSAISEFMDWYNGRYEIMSFYTNLDTVCFRLILV